MGQIMGIEASRLLLGIAVGAVAFTVAGGNVWAAGLAIREQSVEGQGASFAGVAAGTNGLSSMFWNPATMSLHNEQGYMSENNISMILPYARAEDGTSTTVPGSPDSGNIGVNAIVPASYSVYGLTDEITIGVATGAPFGLSTNADTWIGSLHGDESKAVTFAINPNVAYQVNDMLSVAVGLQAEYMNVKLTSDTPAGLEVFKAKADDIGFGFTAGVLFTPNDSTSIGLGFRSSVSHDLKGTGMLATAAFLGDVTASFDSPETVTFGVRHKFNDDLTIMGGVEWANWSRFKSLDIVRDDTGAILATTPERWDDSWLYSVGAEYTVNERLMVRGGFAYEDSGVPDATRTPRLPDNDRYWFSAGASYKMADWITANIAYSYVVMEDGDVSLSAPPSSLDATFKQHLHIVSAGATLDW
jgi:long-chain fatty acid transport protein